MFKRLVEYMQGRHTLFAAFFAVAGVVLQWFHRLDSTFVAYMTALMGMVLGHSIQENHFNVPNVPAKKDEKSLDK